MNLSEIITKVLNNSQIRLVLTEDGFDWMPNDFTGSTQFFEIIDQDGLLTVTACHAHGEATAQDLAEWIQENIHHWIQVAIDNEEDEHEPNRERITFLEHLFSTI